MSAIKNYFQTLKVEVVGDQVNILGIGDKAHNMNMRNLWNVMKKVYDINLQY